MTIEEMEIAIAKLPSKELDQLMAWFEEYYAQMWDKQIEENANSGRLDRLLAEVNEEYDSGLSEPL